MNCLKSLGMQNASKSARWIVPDGRNAHEDSAFINPSNSAF